MLEEVRLKCTRSAGGGETAGGTTRDDRKLRKYEHSEWIGDVVHDPHTVYRTEQGGERVQDGTMRRTCTGGNKEENVYRTEQGGERVQDGTRKRTCT